MLCVLPLIARPNSVGSRTENDTASNTIEVITTIPTVVQETAQIAVNVVKRLGDK